MRQARSSENLKKEIMNRQGNVNCDKKDCKYCINGECICLTASYIDPLTCSFFKTNETYLKEITECYERILRLPKKFKEDLIFRLSYADEKDKTYKTQLSGMRAFRLQYPMCDLSYDEFINYKDDKMIDFESVESIQKRISAEIANKVVNEETTNKVNDNKDGVSNE